MFYAQIFQHIDEETVEDQDGYQALKDDLMIIEQIDGLRKQLKSSYTVRFNIPHIHIILGS